MKLMIGFLLASILGHVALAGISDEPPIIQQPQKQYVGIEISHVPGDALPSKLWAQFSQRKNENASGPLIDLAVGIESDGTAKYAAAQEVSDVSSIPAGTQVLTTPAGSYADFTFTGPLSGLGSALDYVYGLWLPLHHYVATGEGIEVYTSDVDVDSLQFEMHLQVRLVSVPAEKGL